jgi:hypothetical protein
MAVPSPYPPTEWAASVDTKINSGGKSHENGGIFHTSHVPHSQLNQRLATLPLP